MSTTSTLTGRRKCETCGNYIRKSDDKATERQCGFCETVNDYWMIYTPEGWPLWGHPCKTRAIGLACRWYRWRRMYREGYRARKIQVPPIGLGRKVGLS